MLGRTDRRLRHVALLATFVVMAVALGARLSYWQLAEGENLRQRAQAQQARPTLEFVQRGDITDRRGTLLATTGYRDLLAAYPDLIPAAERGSVARTIADLLSLDEQQTGQLVETFERGVPYTIVRRRLTLEESQRIRSAVASGELSAVSLEPKPMRFYPTPGGAPRTTLASHLLGFVTEDGQGHYGIEQYHDTMLAGSDGTTAAIGGAGGPGSAGQGVRLTIDASLQLRVEKELYAAWAANKAELVSAVVMDPSTGAVLAWASVPGYDANNFMDMAGRSPERFLDPVASQIYEPGSVMKMITAAAALEKGVVNRNTVIQDEPFLDYGAYRVRNSDRRSVGKIPFWKVLAWSRNIPTAKVAEMLGKTTTDAAAVLYDVWQRLGLGRQTGVEVSSEARGIAADPTVQPWAPVDLANRSFGQGLAVTPLQLATAYSIMVNGGREVHPHVVLPSDASIAGAAWQRPGGQAISEQLSNTLRELMVNNVESVDEVAAVTKIDGYTVGGKTGTAEYWDAEKGRWANDRYNYTFCGFLGDGEADLVIVVTIQKPEMTTQRNGRTRPRMHSYELFRRLAQTAISVLDLPPDGSKVIEPGAEPSPGRMWIGEWERIGLTDD